MTDPGPRSELPLLRIEDLSVLFSTSRGLLRAVEDVSLTLEQGTTLGLVGESGCGKSVLCRSLLRLLPSNAVLADKGKVLLKGLDVLSLPEKALRRIRGREAAIVLQDPVSSLHPLMKVARQIAEPLIHHAGAPPGDARRRATELLYSVGIPSPQKVADGYPHQLSGGMRQRVALAMALACSPALLIADEPTTALDATVQAEILDLLAELQRSLRMAMILVTHNLAVVSGRTHETAVMYAGRIVEKAPTQALFASPRMPYTKALLEAMPRLDRRPHLRLPTIEGQLPDPLAPLSGCSFAPRCPKAGRRCAVEEPLLRDAGSEGHSVACWYPLGGSP